MSNLTKSSDVQRLDYVEIPRQGSAIARNGNTVIINMNDCECSDLAQSSVKSRPAEAKPFTGFQLVMCFLAAVGALAGVNYWFWNAQYNGAAAREARATAREARATTALLEAQSEASKIMAEGRAKAIAEGFQPDALVPDLCP